MAEEMEHFSIDHSNLRKDPLLCIKYIRVSQVVTFEGPLLEATPLLLFNLGEFGSLERDVGHQSLDIEHKAYNRIVDLGEVDSLAADVDKCDVAIDPYLPAARRAPSPYSPPTISPAFILQRHRRKNMDLESKLS
jgi:hypothetical protein